MGKAFYTLVALDPDIATSEALNYAATEPITAVDKDGNEVINSDEFKYLFSIDRTGKVTVNGKLDRDKFAVRNKLIWPPQELSICFFLGNPNYNFGH